MLVKVTKLVNKGQYEGHEIRKMLKALGMLISNASKQL